MNRAGWLASAALATGLLVAAALAAPRPAGREPPFRFTDDFERGLCTGACPGANWAIRQEVNGTVSASAAPDRSGKALLASAGAKDGAVAKAGLVHRSGPIREGREIRAAFDLYLPAETPINSMQLLDIECATCGEGGNPGIRLYLRRGRLRVDRSKIGIEHAWTNEAAPELAHNRWHRIEWQVRIGSETTGSVRVLLDGREVLAARGATVLAGYADRIQIGITANSNPVSVRAWFDNIAVDVR